MKISELVKGDVIGPFVFVGYRELSDETSFWDFNAWEAEDIQLCGFEAQALIDAFGIVRDGQPLQEVPVSEPWRQWIGQKCEGETVTGTMKYIGTLRVSNGPNWIGYPCIDGICLKPESIRPVSEDVCEWEPATLEDATHVKAKNGTDYLGIDKGSHTSILVDLGCTFWKKSKPSAVPSVVKGTVFNEGWRSDSHELSIRVPELGHWYDWADKPVTVILDSAIVDTFKTMNTEIMLKSDGMKRHVERHHTVIVLEDSHE